MAMTRIALVQGEKRYENVAQALRLIADQVDLGAARYLLIKPNFVSTCRQIAATHVEAVRALLDFLRARYDGPIVIAEGAAVSNTMEGFRHFGYLPLVEAYDVVLLDLNADETVPVTVYDRRFRPLTLRVARTVVEADYRISVGPPKTHDTVVVTLALKNMVMGALVNPRARGGDGRLVGRPETLRRLREMQVLRWQGMAGASGSGDHGSHKMAMHQGYPAINLNLALIAPRVAPHLAVIDGYVGMEGSGPTAGDPVTWRIALAGTNPLAVDWLTTRLMGFDPERVGYLHHLRQMGLWPDPEAVEVVGNADPEAVTRSFRPHPSTDHQYHWQLPRRVQSSVLGP